MAKNYEYWVETTFLKSFAKYLGCLPPDESGDLLVAFSRAEKSARQLYPFDSHRSQRRSAVDSFRDFLAAFFKDFCTELGHWALLFDRSILWNMYFAKDFGAVGYSVWQHAEGGGDKMIVHADINLRRVVKDRFQVNSIL